MRGDGREEECEAMDAGEPQRGFKLNERGVARTTTDHDGRRRRGRPVEVSHAHGPWTTELLDLSGCRSDAAAACCGTSAIGGHVRSSIYCAELASCEQTSDQQCVGRGPARCCAPWGQGLLLAPGWHAMRQACRMVKHVARDCETTNQDQVASSKFINR